MRVAVVGAGISGLGAAYLLSTSHEVDVFEREPRLGGHAHTHLVEHAGSVYRLDSGFLVYNTRTYPLFARLLETLGADTQWSDMSFSVQCRRCRLEYGSRNLRALFAQRRRLGAPSHWRLLGGVWRFFREARRFLAGRAGEDVTLREFLATARVGEQVARHFILPMTGAIWSAPFSALRAFSARSLLQFLDNHGLLASSGAPRWRTVVGGSRTYIDALAARVSGHVRCGAPVTAVHRGDAGVTLRLASGETERYDKLVLATHADEALRLLADPLDEEARLLGHFRYSRNEAILHTDPGVLPRRRAAWGSWNCALDDCRNDEAPASVTYHINRLQAVPGPTEFCVTLNGHPPAPASVLARMSYTHPILDARAVAAQPALAALSGTRHTYYCGAHLRNGFHEDGFASAVRMARSLGVRW